MKIFLRSSTASTLPASPPGRLRRRGSQRHWLPLAGLDADEIIDASPFALAAAGDLNGNSELYNLPRKFKVSITGCSVWCSYPEINDIGLTPAVSRERRWDFLSAWAAVSRLIRIWGFA